MDKLDGQAAIAAAAAQLALDQTEVNEALVQKIFQCERAEQALRDSEHKLHALLIHQLNTREEERKRIARAVHDTLGQNLLALRLDVAALHHQTAARQPRLHGWVGAALANLDGTIASVKQLISDLRPFELELGLQAAVAWEANKFRRSHGIACTVDADPALDELTLDDAHLLALYRVLQECLENVARHAHARQARVRIRVEGAVLTLVIADDGVGIGFITPPPTAFGLLGVRERMGAAGGTMRLSRLQPHGTAVTLTLPLPAQN